MLTMNPPAEILLLSLILLKFSSLLTGIENAGFKKAYTRSIGDHKSLAPRLTQLAAAPSPYLFVPFLTVAERRSVS